MALAKVTDGAPVELPSGQQVAIGDAFASYQTVVSWSDDERNAVGIYTIQENSVPDGKVQTGSSLEFDGTHVNRVLTVEDAPLPSPPDSVTNFQGHAILLQLGMDAAVQSAITAIPDAGQRAIAQLAYDKAEFNRNSPLLLAVATALGKDAEFIDDMFRQAAQIKV